MEYANQLVYSRIKIVTYQVRRNLFKLHFKNCWSHFNVHLKLNPGSVLFRYKSVTNFVQKHLKNVNFLLILVLC